MLEESFAARLPAGLASTLAGKKFGLIGFPPAEAHLLACALRETRSLSIAADAREVAPMSEEARACDIVILNLSGSLRGSKWTDPREMERGGKPLLLAGQQADIHRHLSLEAVAHDVLVRPFQPSEMLLRSSRILSAERAAHPPIAPKPWSARVLLADDDKSILHLLRTVLTTHNVECWEAEDGESTLHYARRVMPDLVVLDLNMPSLGGFEVLEALRSEPGTHAMKVLLLSGIQDSSAIVRGRQLGADDYITKPFSHMELLGRVKKLLNYVAPEPRPPARRIFAH